MLTWLFESGQKKTKAAEALPRIIITTAQSVCRLPLVFFSPPQQTSISPTATPSGCGGLKAAPKQPGAGLEARPPPGVPPQLAARKNKSVASQASNCLECWIFFGPRPPIRLGQFWWGQWRQQPPSGGGGAAAAGWTPGATEGPGPLVAARRVAIRTLSLSSSGRQSSFASVPCFLPS